jgi:chromate transporter
MEEPMADEQRLPAAASQQAPPSSVQAGTPEAAAPLPTIWDFARYYLRLGALGFGGPVALVGEMCHDLMEQRGWVSESEFVEGVAVAQTMPGPFAAQLAMWIGYIRGGVLGATVCALAVIFPPFVLVTVIAALYAAFEGLTWMQALFYGIGPAAVALIFVSMSGLMKLVLRDRKATVIFLVCAVITVIMRAEVAVLIFIAGILGILIYAMPAPKAQGAGAAGLLIAGPALGAPVLQVAGATAVGLTLPALAQLALFFFKAGAFTFGSGLAIMPFMQEGLVEQFRWLTERQFPDTMAVSMITPGPVVIGATFAGYIVAGVVGAAVATVAIFLPPYLMVVLFAPLIVRYRKQPQVQGFIKGATAAAAGTIGGASVIIAENVLLPREAGRATVGLPFGVGLDLFVVALLAVAIVLLFQKRVKGPLLVGIYGLIGLAAYPLLYRGGFSREGHSTAITSIFQSPASSSISPAGA